MRSEGRRNNRKAGNVLFHVIILICGLVFAAVGFFWYGRLSGFRRYGEKAQAEIVRIESYHNSDGEVQYKAYVEFSVNGKVYSGQLDAYTSSMYEGKIVPVLYMPENPQKFIYGKTQLWMPLLFFSVGMALVTGDVAVLIVRAISHGCLRRLRKTGREVLAEIQSVDIKENVRVNGKMPATLICIDDEGNTYKAKVFVYSGRSFIGGEKIRVYVDKNNPALYAVDIKEYMSGGAGSSYD